MKNTFWLVWIGFTVYAFFLAPPDNSEQSFALIQKLVTGQIEDINPLIVALFNLMGVWPLIYSCLLFFDGRGQKIPVWPFAGLSFGVGAFAILPYLALRNPNPNFQGNKSIFLNILESKITAIIITLGSLGLVSWGLTKGDWNNFINQWQTSRFIHVMSLDFCLLSVLFPFLLPDDQARRNYTTQTALSWLFCLPLVGAIIYLCLRPAIKEDSAQKPLFKVKNESSKDSEKIVLEKP